MSRAFPKDRQIRLDNTQSSAPRRQQFASVIELHNSDCTSFGQGKSSPTRDPPVPTAIGQYVETPNTSSARPNNGTYAEPASHHPITIRYSRLCLLLLIRGCCCSTIYDDRHQYQRFAWPMSILPHYDSTNHPFQHVSTVSPPHTQELLWHLPLCTQPLLAEPHVPSIYYFHPYHHPTNDSYD